MSIKGEKLQRLLSKISSEKPQLLQGYPPYDPTEDIYNRSQKVDDMDPAEEFLTNSPSGGPEAMNEKNFSDDLSGDDLDIPGAELDDEQESIGNEDEENNYYSLGGDDHNDLEESKDEF